MGRLGEVDGSGGEEHDAGNGAAKGCSSGSDRRVVATGWDDAAGGRRVHAVASSRRRRVHAVASRRGHHAGAGWACRTSGDGANGGVDGDLGGLAANGAVGDGRRARGDGVDLGFGDGGRGHVRDDGQLRGIARGGRDGLAGDDVVGGRRGRAVRAHDGGVVVVGLGAVDGCMRE